MNSIPRMSPAIDLVGYFYAHLLRHRYISVFGYNITRSAVCRVVAQVANEWETELELWRVLIVSDAYRLGKRDLAEVANHITFGPDPVANQSVRGKNGYIRLLPAHPEYLQGVTGNRILWMVDRLTVDQCWDVIMSSVAGDVMVFAINPPLERAKNIFEPYFLSGEGESK